MVTTTRSLHCWMGRREFYGYDRGTIQDCPHGGHEDWEEHVRCTSGFPDATCLLEDGHPDEHEWTLDGEITLSFAPGSEVS